MFTLLQQAVVVMALLGLFHFLIFWIDGLTGHSSGGWVRWLPMISGAVLWPLVVAAGDTLARRTS
jgi:rod shape-determining protein MreD